MYYRYIGGIMLLLLCFSSCEKFEYNPYQDKSSALPSDLNQKNIDRLLKDAESADDTVTIIFTGDSQRFYHNFEELVEISNRIPHVDFFILAGDISDFGLVSEFEWIDQRMERLYMPYVCAIGNHDLTGNGLQIFRSMYGPENFSFTYKGYKFIFHDSNGREHNFNGKIPDLDWLQQQLNDPSALQFVPVCHVPPYDVDFDRNLEEGYRQLLSGTPGCGLALHGHLHDTDDSFHYHDSVRYIGSNGVGKEQAILLKLIDGKIIKTMIDY
jgi:3',5'-cyclic AMP phosphodiesterase CpdA